MRKLTHYITPGLMAAAMLFAPAMVSRVAAQDPAPAAAPTQEDKDCEDLYNRFVEKWTIKGGAGQTDAYPIGKEYLTKCGQRANEFTDYVRKKVASYEQAAIPFNFNKERAKGPAGDVAVIYQNGKIMIASKPDDLDVLISLGFFGAQAATKGNNTYKADAAGYLKQAAQKLDTGSAPVKWDPFSGPDSGKAWVYYYHARMIEESNPAEAIGYFYKVTQSTASDAPKTNALTELASLYDEANVPSAGAEVAKYNNQPVSPESEAAVNKLHQVLDRANDYYARLVASTTEPAMKSVHDSALARLTDLFKSRNNSVDGLNDFIANVNKKPMPDPKSPYPELPKPATPPATTGGTSTGAASSTGTASGAGAANTSGAKPTMTTGSPAPSKAGTTPPAAPPKPAPVSAKPPTKTKRNHRTH